MPGGTNFQLTSPFGTLVVRPEQVGSTQVEIRRLMWRCMLGTMTAEDILRSNELQLKASALLRSLDDQTPRGEA